MPLLAWSCNYSVGVKALDTQHMNLFEILNELHDAMRVGKGRSVTGPLLENLVKYTKEHFACEERLMEAAGYPELAKHRAAHAALTEKVGAFMARHQKGDGSVNVDLLLFLRDWLKKHIEQEDKEYSLCLSQHGLK